MTVNQRVKTTRLYRKMKSKELARKANVSPSEVSLIESKMRMPSIDILQRIAAALEVSTSFLLGEINADLPLGEALARESFHIFARDGHLPTEELDRLRALSEKTSAPQSVQAWRDLSSNLVLYQKLAHH